MTWKETHVMDERLMFIAEWQSGKKTISEVCREFGALLIINDRPGLGIRGEPEDRLQADRALCGGRC